MRSNLVYTSWEPSTKSTRILFTFLALYLYNYFDRFVTVSPIYTPVSNGTQDNIYITRSYDATSHFETVVEDVHDVFKRVTGKDLELKKRETDFEQ